MNLLQRLAAWLRAIWAVARGYDSGFAQPLPPSPASLRPDPAELIAEAERKGAADAASGMLDNWLFGGADDEVSDRFDPPYVNELRSRCAAALAAARADRAIATDRLAYIRRWRDESQQEMAAAREAMGNVAVREARAADPLALPVQRRRESGDLDGRSAVAQAEATDDPNRNASNTEQVWEGESRVLGAFWRAVVLAGLTAAESTVLRPVLAVAYGPGPESLYSAVAIAALMVGAPYLAALLLRGRRATGAERQVWYLVAALGVAWLVPAVILGSVQGRHLAFAASSMLTPLSVILMFFALLIIIGVMAFMLGLARRHPFQDAYVRHRTTRNNLDVLYRTAADRIFPRYVEDDPAVTRQQDEAVRETYTAAEYAYFAALVRTVGDPSFTEAVQNRRSRRPPLPDPWPDGDGDDVGSGDAGGNPADGGSIRAAQPAPT